MRQFFQIGCAPRPDMPFIRAMSKDEATCKVVESFRERFPDCLIVTTFIKKIGHVYNFMISINGEAADFEED